MKFFSKIFSEVRTYDCGPGKIRTVHKDVDKAFPFYLANYDTQAKAASKLAGNLDVEGSFAVKRTVANVLVKIDQFNSSAQQQFRAAYSVYAAAPCEKLEYLEEEVRRICANDAELRFMEMQLTHALELVRNRKGSSAAAPDDKVIEILRDILMTPQARKLAENIKHVPTLVAEWNQ